MHKSKIYLWSCPITNIPKYVGKTSMSMNIRNNGHRYNAIAEKDDTAKYVWLREILSLNLFPKITILETCDISVSSEREKYWHDYYSQEFTLLNDTHNLGSGNPGVGRIVWTEQLDSFLGKKPDIVLAKALGCSPSNVAYRRKQLGITASFDRTNNTPPPMNWRNTPMSLPQEIIVKLGTIPDYTLAEIAGVDKSTIARARRRLNIGSYAELTGNDGKGKLGIKRGQYKKKINV